MSIPQVLQLQRPRCAGVWCPCLLLPGPAGEWLCAQHPVWIWGAGAGGSSSWGRGAHGGLWGRVDCVAAGPGWGHRCWCHHPAAAGGCGSTHGTEGAQGYYSCEGVGVRATWGWDMVWSQINVVKILNPPVSCLCHHCHRCCCCGVQLSRCGSEGWGFGDVWGAGPAPNQLWQNPEPICVLPIPPQTVGDDFPPPQPTTLTLGFVWV